MSVPQIRATHATRVVNLRPVESPDQKRARLAALSLLCAPAETRTERRDRCLDVLFCAIEEQHDANHQGPRDCCPAATCQALTEVERA